MRAAPAPLPVHIGHIVRNAVAFNFRHPRGASLTDNDLLAAVDRLFALLEERRIGYLLVGGIALLTWVEGRNTEDIDLIMALSDLARLPEIEVASRDRDFARGTFEGLQIDLLLTQNPLFEKVRRDRATRRRFAEREIAVADVEGLLLLKLYALPSLYRQGNLPRAALYETDILTLLHRYEPRTEPLLAELATHLPAHDVKELDRILRDLERRIASFGSAFQAGGPEDR